MFVLLPVWSSLGIQAYVQLSLPSLGSIGMGLNSGSMYIGKDFTIFTKKGNTMTRPFPFLISNEEEGTDEVSPIAYLGLYGHRNLSEVVTTEAKFIFKHPVLYIEEEVMRVPENSSD